jgi:hypothetical protein
MHILQPISFLYYFIASTKRKILIIYNNDQKEIFIKKYKI